MKKDFLYQEIAGNIANKIKTGVLKEGERLPSVRMLSTEHGISVNTAKRIFLELEAQSLAQSKPQSGYFVSPLSYLKLPLPEVSKPLPIANNKEPNDLINGVYSTMGRHDLTLFSIGVPSGNILPLAKLKKEIVLATRSLKEGGTEYEPLQGNLKLRRMVAVRSLAWEGALTEDDVITTSGCMNALALCLIAVTKPGDTLALESPCYPGILQLAVSMGLHVLEIATHPVSGIDIDALKKLLPQINVCLLVPNFNTPLGYCMPDQNKKEIVTLLAQYNIPLIEDDTYGDIHFGPERPKCCKSFDTDGNVLWCGSVSKTLAPGYRVGWIAPGKYKDQILKLKLIHAISSTSIIHEAVGNFLMTGRYDNHLRHFRKTLQENYQRYALAISAHFPDGTKISRPQGGLALWVELPKQIDTAELYNYALKKQISIAPGRMFTLQNQFQHCMRLCIGLPWTEELQLKLKQLGNLAKMLA
ncbi:aminotransferase-like domain-containing protein [Sphingobacterium pedocola]|uniref:PLP-dependent aminotransferase family protein n=1 Tax=Sphingobacterium pedocola TaxID=2082722 RepID=A0ABR9T724_9SPHI|nr:PLP-dependent aminotransferase family protein [Sphingobacterium pedocola]MBE8721131.1 PLP-dependent aminotransferase family protein [Sphingobacterium pedocola]